MFKASLYLAAAFVLLAPSAYALNDNTGSVAGNNNELNQITGNGNVLNTGSGAFGSSASVTNTNTANGGAGGNATANGGGVVGSGNSSATGGSVRDSGNSSSVATGGQGGRGGDGGNQSQSATTGNQSQNATTGSQSVSISNKRNPVASAAPGLLVAADDTCMGSSSAGAQGIGFGVSFGSTWTDGDCVRRKDARELHNMGYKPAAIALLCQSPQVAKAMATAGTPCASEAEVAGSADWERTVATSSIKPANGSRNN